MLTLRNSRLFRRGIYSCYHQFNYRSLSRFSRAENLSKLCKNEFDVLVVGGGSTGSGIALDAASRGLSVAMIERDDFGAGTSSRSTKLLWAGSRYLVQALVKFFSPSTLLSPKKNCQEFLAEFKMVMNCHKERTFLLSNHKHLTWWLPIAVPMDKWFLWPAPFNYPLAALGPFGLFSIFFKFYDFLGGFVSPPSHIMTKARTLRKFPQLADRVKFCVVFYEGQHNDSRTNTAISLTAADHGAVIANHVSVVGFVENEDGKVSGLYCEDQLPSSNDNMDTKFQVKGKVVILCGGPLTDELRGLQSHDHDDKIERAVQGASGTHIVLPAYLAPAHMGLVDMATSDGRFLFFLPWLGKTLVGTTDVACSKPLMRPKPTEEEIQWLVDEASKYLVFPIRRSDVLSAWSGVRPLAIDPHASQGETASLSRDHVVSVDPKSGVMFVAGGKWTTYREMAQDAVDEAVDLLSVHHKQPPVLAKSCSTLTLPLVGSHGFNRTLPALLQREFGPGLSPHVAIHLARTYGGDAFHVLKLSRPPAYLSSTPHAKEDPKQEHRRVGTQLIEGFPYLEEEVIWAVRNEYACRASDIIGQRTRLAYLDHQAAINALPRIVEIMSCELNWSEETQAIEEMNAKQFLSTFGGPNVIQGSEESLLEDDGIADQEAMSAVFAGMDVDGSGEISLDELLVAIRLLGVDDAVKSDEEIILDLLAEFPELDNGSTVTIDEFQSWWRVRSTLSPSAVALRKKLFQKYAVTDKKMKGHTGVAFG